MWTDVDPLESSEHVKFDAVSVTDKKRKSEQELEELRTEVLRTLEMVNQRLKSTLETKFFSQNEDALEQRTVSSSNLAGFPSRRSNLFQKRKLLRTIDLLRKVQDQYFLPNSDIHHCISTSAKKEEVSRKRVIDLTQLEPEMTFKEKRLSDDQEIDLICTESIEPSCYGNVEWDAIPFKLNPPRESSDYPCQNAQFEINFTALMALRLIKDPQVEDFSIQIDAGPEFGQFSDVIIHITLESGDRHNFALQVKEELERSNWDSILEKYCTAFKNSSLKVRQNYHHILYTCQNSKAYTTRKKQSGKFKIIPDNQRPGKTFFDTNSQMNSTYKFQINSEASKREGAQKLTDLNYRDFFSKFTLYTFQKSSQDLEKLIFGILKERDVVEKYLIFFKKWRQGRFPNKIIDRETTKAHLLDCYLWSSMVLEYRLSDNENQKMYLFEKFSKMFDVTIIDDSKDNFIDNLSTIGEDFDNFELKPSENSNLEMYKDKFRIDARSTLTECILRIAKGYKFVERSENKLDDKTRKKIFCIFIQNLIIVDFNEKSSDSVHRFLEFYQTKRDQFKLILLGRGSDPSKLSSVQVFRNLDHLVEKNDDLLRELMTSCVISLQDHQLVTLKSLVESFDDLKSTVETKDIVRMLRDGYSIGEEKLPPNYVSRSASTIGFDLNTILRSAQNQNNRIIINFRQGFGQVRELIESEGIDLLDISQYTKKKPKERPLILSTEELYLQEEIRRIRSDEPLKSIFVFKMISEDLFILTRSTSKFEFQNFKTGTFPEEEVHSVFDGNLNLLIDGSGTGKTTFLKRLTNKCSVNFWTIYMDLKFHRDFFREVRTIDEILTHLINSEADDTNFVRRIKGAFAQRKKCLLFDGLDELPMTCVDNILSAIDGLLVLGHKIWLSSRENLEVLLSERFNLFGLRLTEFSEYEQKKFLQDRLESVYDQNQISGFIDLIFPENKLMRSSQLLGIPLWLHMLAQIFLDQTRDHLDMSEDFFELTKLCQCFFLGRFHQNLAKFKYDPHSPFLLDAAEYLQLYEVAALDSVLDEDSFKRLQIDCRANLRFLSEIETRKDPLGVIAGVHRGRAIFEHRAFAEYFVSVWLKHNQDELEVVKSDLSSESCERLCRISHAWDNSRLEC